MLDSKLLTIVENNANMVVIEIKQLTPLDVAKHPYFNINDQYITITKGPTHTLKKTQRDGKSISFDWGVGGYTLISETLKALKIQIIQYLHRQFIYLERQTIEEPHTATVCYNGNLKLWQITLYDENEKVLDYIWLPELKSKEDCFAFIKKQTIAFSDPIEKTAQTGITVWDLERVQK